MGLSPSTEVWEAVSAQGFVRNLIHGFLGLQPATALTALEAMFCVLVPSSHQSRETVCNGGSNRNLIPGFLGLKLAVALSALEMVFCVIVLSNRQQRAVE